MIRFWSHDAIIVRRCQVLLDFEVLDRWDHELSQMNFGKVGEPYYYPDSFIELLGYMKAYFHIPYRETERVVRAYVPKVPSIPHYSTISRRINKLEIKINKKLGNDIVIALDNTGIKLAKRGECMHHKWHVREGYLKIYINQETHEIGDIRKGSLYLDITSEEVHDGKIRDQVKC